ncbi:uncharacterized protein Hap1MRO34_005918 isoform 2-T2 [Clarias gariepinus]
MNEITQKHFVHFDERDSKNRVTKMIQTSITIPEISSYRLSVVWSACHLLHAGFVSVFTRRLGFLFDNIALLVWVSGSFPVFPGCTATGHSVQSLRSFTQRLATDPSWQRISFLLLGETMTYNSAA